VATFAHSKRCLFTSHRTAWPPAPRAATLSSATVAHGQQCSEVSGCGRKPSKVFNSALALLLECAEYLLESPLRILHAPSLMGEWVAQPVPSDGRTKTNRAGVSLPLCRSPGPPPFVAARLVLGSDRRGIRLAGEKAERRCFGVCRHILCSAA
jgi:hypothetical protein